MTRWRLSAALLLALAIDGCACEQGDPAIVDAAVDPTTDARRPDAWARVDAARDDAGPDAYDPAEDPCVTAPRSAACARELIRGLDADFCQGERACGRPVTEEGCEVYYPREGADLVRANEDELTLVRLGLLEIDREAVACLRERIRTCSQEDPQTCGALFRATVEAIEGQPCRHTAQCGPTMWCSGLDSPSAFRGMGFCSVGSCVPRFADGEACEVPHEYDVDRPIGPCRSESVCVGGTCVAVTASRPAALYEACGFVREGSAAVYRGCRESQCRSPGPGLAEVCMPVVAMGEPCDAEALCTIDAVCFEGRCAPRVLLGDPCDRSNEGLWCTFEAFGSACIDGVCVANERRLGDVCHHFGLQPCSEGVCAQDEDMRGPSTCQPSLRSAVGGLCRGTDGDCLDGVCCSWACVSLGGLS